MRYFNGKKLKLPDKTVIKTKEGISAYKEAIKFLTK